MLRKTEGPLNTKGWVCGVVEKGSDWLGSYTGHHTKGSVDEHATRICNKDKISHGTCAPLQRVKYCGLSLPVPGRNCERGRKGTPRSSSQPVKTDGHRSSE